MRILLTHLSGVAVVGVGVAACEPGEPEPEDRVLEEALRPASGETIDCEGGALRAASDAWDPIDPITRPADLTVQVGIFLDDVQDVTIENCEVEGFQLGILAVGGGGHEIADNVVDTRGVGVWLLASTDVEIARNEFRGGEGVWVNRRSHRARFVENRFEHAWPGEARGIATYDIPAGDMVVQMYIVDGELFQVPNEAGSLDDPLIEDNEFTLEDGGIGVYNAVRSKDSTVRGNTFTGGSSGIDLPGFPLGLPVGLPGTCSADSTRYCAHDADCFIEGFDATSLGTCTFAAERVCWFSGVPCTEDCDAENLDLCGYFVEDTLVIQSSDVTGNTVTGSCIGIGASHAVDLLVGDNDLTGPVDASNCEYAAGVALSAESFESAVVSENTAAGFTLGLDLYQAEATSFGARISRNDFGDNALPWWAFAENEDTQEPIAMHPIELSADGAGNYWGLSCDEGVNGFPPQSFCVGGDNHYFQCTGPEGCPGGECVAATSVTDSHPFGEPPGPSSVPCVP